jgi:epoxyqueuosine reductase
MGDYRLDARKCISYLTIELKGSIPPEFRRAIGNRIFGCDDCLTVCPWNRFAREAREFSRHRHSELGCLDPVEILGMDEATFRSRFAGTPIRRLGLSRLQRNAAVVLGNTANERAIPALAAAAAGSDAMVAEHARWALEQRACRQGLLEAKPAAA